MSHINEVQHDLRRDFHNMMSLIKFIHEEKLTTDEDISKMLKLCLEREENTIGNLNKISKFISENKV